MNAVLEKMKQSYALRTADPIKALKSQSVKLGLNPGVLGLALKHNAAKNLPYHNNSHSMNVAYDAVILAEAENLDYSTYKHLFVAGLFHDYNHSGGNLSDTENVHKAIEGLLKYETLLDRSNVDIGRVTNLILGTNTEKKRHPGTFEGCLLKDADLIGWAYLPFLNTASGLASELNIEVTENSTRNFLQQNVFHTPTAKEVLASSQWG